MPPSGTAAPPTTSHADPTRVVRGVVTGIGFLGAGVIMKDGLSISGLTTAASIWAASAIGVLLGVGFYAAALLMALLCMLSMSVLHGLEARLPGRSTLEVCLTFSPAGPPTFEELVQVAEARGYRVQQDSLRITFDDSRPVWRFCVVALDRARAASPALLARGDGHVGGRGQLQHRAGSQLTDRATAAEAMQRVCPSVIKDETLTQIGVIPVVRHEFAGGCSPWFAEGGIGATVTSSVYRGGDKRFSTAFNFGDQVGVGWAFGEARQHEPALHVEHFSNAGIKHPNPGENFIQFRYLRRFG